jgi:hypothetical protein
MGQTRIMYLESKSGSLDGPARIGRVTLSKTGKSLTYRGRTFQRLKGKALPPLRRPAKTFNANYFDVETGEEFWISAPRRDGQDRRYPESTRAVEIDDDVAEEYWRDLRTSAPTKPVNAVRKRALRASELAVFVKAAGRKAHKGVEPNDRHRADPEFAKRLRRMPPEEFDRLLYDDEENDI